jgi:hypothetical protein
LADSVNDITGKKKEVRTESNVDSNDVKSELTNASSKKMMKKVVKKKVIKRKSKTEEKENNNQEEKKNKIKKIKKKEEESPDNINLEGSVKFLEKNDMEAKLKNCVKKNKNKKAERRRTHGRLQKK